MNILLFLDRLSPEYTRVSVVFIICIRYFIFLYLIVFFFSVDYFVYTRLGPRLTTNYPPPPTVGFMNPSILTAGGTLRRPRVEYDSAPPRILSKIDIEPQFYYGWPLLSNKMLSSPTTSDTVGLGTNNTTTTSSPKTNMNTIAMQNIERSGTPTLSISTSSPTSTLTKKLPTNNPLTSDDQRNNKNTVVLCPPSRTYCF